MTLEQQTTVPEKEKSSEQTSTREPISSAQKVAFFPGCLIPVKYPQMELSVRRTLPKLGIELVDIDEFTCCPDPIYFKSADKMAWLTIAARNLCLAEEKGLDLFTICSGCTATLSETAHLLAENEELLAKVNTRLERIGKHYDGTVRVRHIVTLIRDEVGIEAVRQSVERPLEELSVAIHYGCHLLKPSPIMNVDDPDTPHMMEDLLNAIGARPVRHDEWILCCGKAIHDEEIPQDMMATVLSSVKNTDADCLCVICPSCFGEFDLGQLKVSRRLDRDLKTPAVYYCQLLGIAQGLSARDVGLHRHRVKAEPILEFYPD